MWTSTSSASTPSSAADTPVVSAVRPNGPHLIEQFEAAGGARAVLKQLGDLIDPAPLTVSGRSVGDNVAAADVADPEIIRPADRPFTTEPLIVVLRGSLAPDGGIVKLAVGDERPAAFTGPARCFESQEDAVAALADGKSPWATSWSSAGSDRGAGPAWAWRRRSSSPSTAPGSPARSRSSPTASCPGSSTAASSSARSAPEAADGGPLSLVRDGDTVHIDLPGRVCDLRVDARRTRREAAGARHRPPRDRLVVGLPAHRAPPRPRSRAPPLTLPHDQEAAMALPDVPPSTVITEADERRSARGGAFSMFVDSFDVYLPALVLPAAMAYFMPANLSPEIRATFTTLLFTVGLLARPIGSVIFGNLSDRIGRKPVTMISGWGFTIVTLLIGLLPGYAVWNYGAIAVFAVLRLIGGIFLAGGYAAPMPLALEQANPARRGRVGGLIGVGAPGSFLVINLLLLGLLDVLPHGGFLSWGWRIPFFLGFVLGLVYLWHYRGVKEDDSVFQRRRTGRQPVAELFTTHRALLFSVFLFTCGYWFATQMSVSFLPTLLVQVLDQSPRLSSTVEIISSVLTMILILVLAAVGQRIGRRALLMRWALVLTFVVGGAFALLAVAARAGRRRG